MKQDNVALRGPNLLTDFLNRSPAPFPSLFLAPFLAPQSGIFKCPLETDAPSAKAVGDMNSSYSVGSSFAPRSVRSAMQLKILAH